MITAVNGNIPSNGKFEPSLKTDITGDLTFTPWNVKKHVYLMRVYSLRLFLFGSFDPNSDTM